MTKPYFKNTVLSSIIPSSRLGLLSLIFFSVAYVLLSIVLPKAFTNSGIGRHESFATNPTLMGIMVISFLLILSGLIVGVLGIWKQKERSAFVITPIVFSLTMILAITIAVLAD